MLRSHLYVFSVALTFATTALSQTTWTSFEDRKGHAIASDPNGGVLMFGGESVKTSGKLLDDTRRLSTDKKWTAATALLQPLARTEHAIAAGNLSPSESVFVMFGGLRKPDIAGPNVVTDETFRYVGGDWVKVDPPMGAMVPEPHTGHAMVHDRNRNKIILFGGRSSGGAFLDDTWEFDPLTNTWTEFIVTGGVRPPARFNHSLAYSTATGLVYLFGGPGNLDDTWTFRSNTSTWTDVSSATRPPGRRESAMAFHDIEANVVLFGGRNTTTALDDTWILNPLPPYDWTQVTPTTTPPARFAHAMSVDQLGNEVVLLGGTDQLSGGSSAALEGTWIWANGDWRLENPQPSPRLGAALAYDANDARHVLYGGRDSSSGVVLDETWTLDGLNWRQESPPTSPSPPRTDAGMCYDAGRDRVVVFGGRQGGACGAALGDTWEWNGTTWSSVATTSSPPNAGGVQPVYDSKRGVIWMLVDSEMWKYDNGQWALQELAPPRRHFGAAYDSARDRAVIFGGDADNGILGDTWEWGAGGWEQRFPATSPSQRRWTQMTYDPTTGKCLLVGGRFSQYLGDTWEWDGSAGTWTDTLATLTPRRAHACLNFDHGQGRPLLAFGTESTSITYTNCDLWDGVAGAWTPANEPPFARYGLAAASRPPSGPTVAFGGWNQSQQVYDETWKFDGTWSEVSPASSPPARMYARMAYDPNSNKLLLFGGAVYLGGQTFSPFGDTWLYNDAGPSPVWTQASPATSPPARYGHALVESPDGPLLFGGSDGTGNLPLRVWRWNGSDWELLDALAPTPRTNYGAAYDSRRDRVVVFGGRTQCGSGSYLNETWEWDGDSWLQRFPANSPAPRERCHLAYDASRSRVVLYGGAGSIAYSDTWEWDGDNWIERAPAAIPGASFGHGLSYDVGRRLTVLQSEVGTWDYGSERPGETISTDTVSTCLSVLGTTPQLVPTEWNGPWVGDSIGLDFIDMPPSIPILNFGFTPLPIPLNLFFLGSPDCELAVSPDVIEPLFPLVLPYESGPLPNDPALEGVSLYAQATFLDLFGGPLVTSNSLQLTLGSK